MTSRRDQIIGPLWSGGSYFTDPERDRGEKPKTVRERIRSCIFIAECDGLIKIGTTSKRPREAVQATGGIGAAPKRLLAVIPDAGPIRKDQLREMFAHTRVHGDWYERSPELDALIATFAA